MRQVKYAMLLLCLSVSCNSDPDSVVPASGISIYPNPALDFAHITTHLGNDVTIEVIDGSGVSFFKQPAQDKTTVTVRVGGRSPGIFHVVVASGKKTVAQQFIKL